MYASKQIYILHFHVAINFCEKLDGDDDDDGDDNGDDEAGTGDVQQEPPLTLAGGSVRIN